MRKLYSLIKACMTSDMSLFKIKTNKNKKSAILIPLFIAGYLMFMIWGSANSLFEKLEPMNLQSVILSFFIFGISIMTFMEGIYKAGPLMFNCKDDQLLLSLPIKRRTVLFVRIFKFYVFELLFHSMFLFPIMIAYIRWAENISWTYFFTCFIMLLLLPIIPIILSCMVGMIISSISSRFKYKNIMQIVISMIFLIGILYFSYHMDGISRYLVQYATNMNDLITKIYYPAFVFVKLVIKFSVLDLIIFILVNVCLFMVSMFVLSRFYFRINSRLKSVTTIHHKVINIDNLNVKKNLQMVALVKKEISTFFKIPVFVINAGFALVLFILGVIIISLKFDSVIPLLSSEETGLGLSKEMIVDNLSILIFGLISLTAFMTSITNSVISLEGGNISILKSLPIRIKTILMSKVLAALVITTPVLLIGDFILFIRFKIDIVEGLLLLILSILIPLVSHFIGIIVNLKYPKFDWESSTEVVKQSTSSFIAVMIGMLLFIVSIVIITNVIGDVSAFLILLIATFVYLVIDIILYMYLMTKGVKNFNDLTV